VGNSNTDKSESIFGNGVPGDPKFFGVTALLWYSLFGPILFVKRFYVWLNSEPAAECDAGAARLQRHSATAQFCTREAHCECNGGPFRTSVSRRRLFLSCVDTYRSLMAGKYTSTKYRYSLLLSLCLFFSLSATL